MDQPSVGAETFVLKTNVHTHHSEKMMTKLLLDTKGVERVFPEASELGKVTILGTIHPRELMMILWKHGVDSKDLPNVPRPQSPVKENHIIDKKTWSGLNELVKDRGVKFVVVEKTRVEVTFKEDKNVQHLDGKNGSCSSTNLHKNKKNSGEDEKNYDCDFYGNHAYCHTRNQGYCHDCGLRNRRPMAPCESIPLGVPCPAWRYSSSAPPEHESYQDPPVEEQTCCIVM